MIIAVDPVHLVKPGPGSHIDFTSYDRLDSGRLGSLIKSHTPVHYPVVSDGNRSLPQFFEVVKHTVDSAGTVQQAVLGMDMKVGELTGGIRHFLSLRQQCGPVPPAFSADEKGRIC